VFHQEFEIIRYSFAKEELERDDQGHIFEFDLLDGGGIFYLDLGGEVFGQVQALTEVCRRHD